MGAGLFKQPMLWGNSDSPPPVNSQGKSHAPNRHMQSRFSSLKARAKAKGVPHTRYMRMLLGNDTAQWP